MQSVISLLSVSDFKNSMLKYLCGLFSLHHIVCVYIYIYVYIYVYIYIYIYIYIHLPCQNVFQVNLLYRLRLLHQIFACRTISDDIIELNLPVTYSLYFRAMNNM